MSIHLKNAVQHLDAHIAELTLVRDGLAALLSPDTVTLPVVQTPEPPEPVNRQDAKAQRKGNGPAALKASPWHGGGRKATRTVSANAPMTATHPRMIQLARAFKEPFGLAEVVAAGVTDTKRAGNILTNWALKKWIHRVGRKATRTVSANAPMTATHPRMIQLARAFKEP